MNDNQIIRLADRENGYVITMQTPEKELQAAQRLIAEGVLRITDRFGIGQGVRLRVAK